MPSSTAAPASIDGDQVTIALRRRAFASHEAGQLKLAELLYREVLSRYSEDVQVASALGVLALQTQRYEWALQLLTEVLRVDDSAAVNDYIGNALCGLNRLHEALGYHEHAIALNPGYASAHINRARVLHGLSQPTARDHADSRASEPSRGPSEFLAGAHDPEKLQGSNVLDCTAGSVPPRDETEAAAIDGAGTAFAAAVKAEEIAPVVAEQQAEFAEKAPAVSEQAPAVSEQAPVVVPVVAETGPVVAEQVPVVGDTAPAAADIAAARQQDAQATGESMLDVAESARASAENAFAATERALAATESAQYRLVSVDCVAAQQSVAAQQAVAAQQTVGDASRSGKPAKWSSATWRMERERAAPILVSLVLAVFLCAELVHAATIIWHELRPRPELSRAETPYTQPKSVDVAGIVARHLFGTVLVARNPAESSHPLTNLELTGTLATEDPHRGLAILGEQGKPHVYTIGDSFGDASLAAIYKDRVVIEREGSSESLYLPRAPGLKVHPPASAAPAAATLAAEQVAAALGENAAQIDKLADSNPETDASGSLLGIRVVPGKDRAAFANSGLIGGDIVVSLNGAKLDSNAGENIWKQAGSGSTVTVLRRGVMKDITLNLSP